MKILVTGADGFVGTHLCHELRQYGHELVPLSYHGAGESLRCDITVSDQIARICDERRPDAIVHLAGIAKTNLGAEAISELGEVNVIGTFNVCKAASRLPQATLLYVSSGLVYAGNPGTAAYSERDPISTPHVYSQSKLAAEEIVNMYGFMDQLKTYIVRPFNHIGPHQSDEFVVAALAKRIKAAKSGDTIVVGDLETYRDFVDVRDIARAYRLIVEKKPDERLFVLGGGVPIRIRDILDQLIAISGKSIQVRVASELLRKQDPAKVCANPRLAREILGWQPTITLAESLRDVYASSQA